jgi:hypothetical protein
MGFLGIVGDVLGEIPGVSEVMSVGETVYHGAAAAMTDDPHERDSQLAQLAVSAVGMIPGVSEVMHTANTVGDVASMVTGQDMSVAGLLTRGLDYATGANDKPGAGGAAAGGGGGGAPAAAAAPAPAHAPAAGGGGAPAGGGGGGIFGGLMSGIGSLFG